MSMINEDSSFFAEILEDYYAECNEHLITIRKTLLSLEALVGHDQLPPSLVEELFRRIHSLKGISSMVDYGEIADVAHYLESYLRLLRKNQSTLTAKAYDGLVLGTRALETSLSARRQRHPPRDNDMVVALLQTLGSGQALDATAATTAPDSPISLSFEQEEQLQTAVSAGQHIWQFEFTPSPELAAQNINVNTLRDQFDEIGQLIRGVPIVTPNGGISFCFLVASDHTEAQLIRQFGEHVTWRPYETAVPSSAPPRFPCRTVAPVCQWRTLDNSNQHGARRFVPAGQPDANGWRTRD